MIRVNVLLKWASVCGLDVYITNTFIMHKSDILVSIIQLTLGKGY